MAGAFVKKSTQLFADNATSVAPSLASTVAGNHVEMLVEILNGDTTSPSSAVGTPTNSWLRAIGPVGPAGADAFKPACAIFYKENIAGGTESGTITMPTGSYARVTITEHSGIATSGSLDVTASSVGVAVTSGDSGTTATTTNADSIALCVGGAENGVSITAFSSPAATGWTVVDTEPTNGFHGCGDSSRKILTTTGTQQGSWTFTPASPPTAYFAGVIAVFKGVAAAAGTDRSIQFPFPFRPLGERTGRGGLITRMMVPPQQPHIAAVSNDVTIAVTGVTGTGSVGTVTPSVDKALTGVSATSSPGTVTPSVSTALTGVSSTGSVGTVSPAIDKALTGVSATGSVGSVGVNVTVALTGVSATGSVGNVIPNVAIGITGVTATGTVGTVSPVYPATVALTGVSATGSVGNLTPSVDKGLTGVSAAGSPGTVSPAADKAISGVSATGSVGNVTPSVDKVLTGVTGTGSVGSVTPSVDVALTGVTATGSVGIVTAVGDKEAALTGVTATGSVGTVVANISKGITGVSATGSVGSVSPSADVGLTGVNATGSVGQVGVNVTVALTGVTATGSVGTMVVGGTDVTVALTGVTAVGSVGNLTPVIGPTNTGSSGMRRWLTQYYSEYLEKIEKARAARLVSDGIAQASDGVLTTEDFMRAVSPEPVVIKTPELEEHDRVVREKRFYRAIEGLKNTHFQAPLVLTEMRDGVAFPLDPDEQDEEDLMLLASVL